jgi:type VI protein secretion system component Hcp
MAVYRALMRIQGIAGDSTVPGYSGAVDLVSVEWGAGRNVGPVAGLPAGTTLPKLVQVRKKLDRSSVPIAALLLSRQSPPVEVIVLYVAAGTSFETVKLTLRDARVESLLSSQTEGGFAVPLESVAFSYARLDFEYQRLLNGAVVEGGRYSYEPAVPR